MSSDGVIIERERERIRMQGTRKEGIGEYLGEGNTGPELPAPIHQVNLPLQSGRGGCGL